MKTVILNVLAIPFLFCCRQADKTPPQPPPADTLTVSASRRAAANPPISRNEARVYGDASKHFFDSLFRHGLNGGVLVAKNGEIVYERYAGFCDFHHRRDSLTAHSPIHLASVSKTFTAMAVLKLWEEGKLDIHEDCSKYLPGFAPGISIKNLLSQRSGLENYVHFMDQSGWDRRRFLTNIALLDYVNKHRAQVQHLPANRHFEYSNTNYALLALIVEKVSGETYAEFLQHTFFSPLGMRDSYVFTAADTAKCTKSYHLNGRPFPLEYLDIVYGDKNIYSTPRDLLKWDAALRSGLLFKQSTLDSAYMPYSLEKPGRRNYGLGWRMIVMPYGKKLIYHNGWWHGNRTVFIRMQEENATIIGLCNNDNKRMYASKKLCDVFGNYQQGHENFDEPENDPQGRGGEKR